MLFYASQKSISKFDFHQREGARIRLPGLKPLSIYPLFFWESFKPMTIDPTDRVNVMGYLISIIWRTVSHKTLTDEDDKIAS